MVPSLSPMSVLAFFINISKFHSHLTLFLILACHQHYYLRYLPMLRIFKQALSAWSRYHTHFHLYCSIFLYIFTPTYFSACFHFSILVCFSLFRISKQTLSAWSITLTFTRFAAFSSYFYLFYLSLVPVLIFAPLVCHVSFPWSLYICSPLAVFATRIFHLFYSHLLDHCVSI